MDELTKQEEQEMIEWAKLKELIDWDYEWFRQDNEGYNEFVRLESLNCDSEVSKNGDN